MKRLVALAIGVIASMTDRGSILDLMYDITRLDWPSFWFDVEWEAAWACNGKTRFWRGKPWFMSDESWSVYGHWKIGGGQ
jgi:hypothetical protein